MYKLFKGLAATAAILVSVGALAATPVLAATPLITVDENGNGTLDFGPGGKTALTGVLLNDPGPGGLNNVLTYDLGGPPSLTPGDVLLLDGGVPLDVVRFNDYNAGGVNGYPASLVFYSDNLDGFDSLADTAGPPSALYTNVAFLVEHGNEVNNGAFYHPTPGQPGYVPGFDVAYELISDGFGAGVPEPATWVVMMLGFGGIGGMIRASRKQTATAV